VKNGVIRTFSIFLRAGVWRKSIEKIMEKPRGESLKVLVNYLDLGGSSMPKPGYSV